MWGVFVRRSLSNPSGLPLGQCVYGFLLTLVGLPLCPYIYGSLITLVSLPLVRAYYKYTVSSIFQTTRNITENDEIIIMIIDIYSLDSFTSTASRCALGLNKSFNFILCLCKNNNVFCHLELSARSHG